MVNSWEKKQVEAFWTDVTTFRDTQIVSGNELLVPAALAALKQWQYKPTLVNGEPVEVTQVDINVVCGNP